MKPIEKEFSQGVKILLERMQNNPEDFVSGDDPYKAPKFEMFANLMNDVIRGERVKNWQDWYLFTKAEQTALIEGYKDMMRTRFDQGIMRKLLEEPQEPVIKKEYYGKPITASEITTHALRVLEKEFVKPTPTKFMLNPSQVALINKLGVSPEDYARKTGMIP
jgi:hypothetical protein